MTTFFTGLFSRWMMANSSKRTGPLRVEQLEPRQQCAVDVQQELNYIVVEGHPDAGSLTLQHEAGESPYDDKIIVSWTSDGHREMRAFDLYKFIDRGGQRFAVKNVEYLEFSGGAGRNKFWSQTTIANYLNDSPKIPELHAAVYGESTTSLWSDAAPLPVVK